MARQPQVVKAVIRPCHSPVPKKAKRYHPPQHILANTKSKSLQSAHQKQSRPLTSSSDTTESNFAKPTTSTHLKSKCSSAAHLDGRSGKTFRGRAPASVPKRKFVNSANDSAPLTTQNIGKTWFPAATRQSKVTSSVKSQHNRDSSPAGSTGQHSSPVSSRTLGTQGKSTETQGKSTSLSSRAPQTSSADRRSSRISAVSTRTRYPAVTSATSDSGRRRSPSRDAPSGRPHPPRAASPRLVHSASHEARLNRVKDHIDHLRRTSPRIDSPEFTSTRTNLCGRDCPPPGQAPATDTDPRYLTGNPTVLFSSPGRFGSRSHSRSRSKSRSRSGSRSRSRSRSSCEDMLGANGHGRSTTTWLETRNRAPAMGTAVRAITRASPPQTSLTKRQLPRVSYPRPSPATALRARSSSSQTRRSTSRERRMTLRSRGDRHHSPDPGTRVERHQLSRTSGTLRHPASPRKPARTPVNPHRAARTPGNLRRAARTPGNPRRAARTSGNPHRAGGTSAGRAAVPAIDYSPQSRYMAGLVRRGAVRRQGGKENRPPAGSETGSARRQGHKSQPGRTLSVASQRSTASEPAQSPQKPARSILRTSQSAHGATSGPAPPHYGYDWVSDMLDLSAPLPCSKKDVQAARKFRDNNWSATHGRAPGQGPTSGDSPSSSPQQDKHRCVHEYYINSRLFPTPLYTDAEGRSQCAVCLAVGPAPPAPSRRARSRSPAGSRATRPRSRSGPAARRSASPARRRSSVSWCDGAESRRGRAVGVSAGQRGRTSRSRSPGGPLCVTCPNCRHQVSLSAARLSGALSDSREPPRGRQTAPAAGPGPPPRLGTLRCPEEQGETPSPAEEQSRRRRSPVTLRSRTPSSRQPVRAMVTVPTALFGETGRRGGGGADWDAAGSLSVSGGSGHPLWPRRLELSPARVRPMARGWPGPGSRGDLAGPTDRLQRAAAGQLRAGRNPAPRRSVQLSTAAARDSYSLRRCIGEKL